MSDSVYTHVKRLGDKIWSRGIDLETGKRWTHTDDFCPTLFTDSAVGGTGFSDIYGQPCTPRFFEGGMREATSFKKNSAVPVKGQEDFVLQWIAKNYGNELEVDPKKVRKCFFDIEVDSPEFPFPEKAKYQITTITTWTNVDDRFHAWSQKPWKREDTYLEDKTVADRVDFKQMTERDILSSWILLIRHKEIDILSGWNSEGFDVPYIINRIRQIFGESVIKKLSPFNHISKKTINTKYGEQTVFGISGISHLDYQQLYTKFTFTPRPDYKLQTIAEEEGIEGKIQYEGSLDNLWHENPQLYMDYNIQDVNVILELDQKLKLCDLAVSMAYYAGVNFETVFSPIKTWDAIIFNDAKRNNLVIPESKPGEEEEFEGAYVVPTKPGFWDWVVSFDLTSLYPSVIRMMNISPETVAGDTSHEEVIDYVYKKPDSVQDKLNSDEFAMTPNGRLFKREPQGIIAKNIEKVFFQRKDAKKTSKDYEKQADSTSGEEKDRFEKLAADYDIFQHNLKILINSLYGAIGSRWFRYYDNANALAVTSMGQLVNRWMGRKTNEWISEQLGYDTEQDYIAAGDTDSIYVTLNEYVERFLKPKVGNDPEKLVKALDMVIEKRIKPHLEAGFQELHEYMNGRENTLSADREVIAKSGVFVAKKRYFLDVWDDEGKYVPGGKLKITGMESVKGGTPKWARKELPVVYKKILQRDKNEVHTYIHEKETEYAQRSIYDIAKTISANNLEKYIGSDGQPQGRCPGHIRAVAAYNRICHDAGCEAVGEGDKVQMVELQKPNKIEPGNPQLPSFAWVSGEKLPMDLEKQLSHYTDHELLFYKTFKKPLESIFDAIDWSHENTSTMDSFM